LECLDGSRREWVGLECLEDRQSGMGWSAKLTGRGQQFGVFSRQAGEKGLEG